MLRLHPSSHANLLKSLSGKRSLKVAGDEFDPYAKYKALNPLCTSILSLHDGVGPCIDGGYILDGTPELTAFKVI